MHTYIHLVPVNWVYAVFVCVPLLYCQARTHLLLLNIWLWCLCSIRLTVVTHSIHTCRIIRNLKGLAQQIKSWRVIWNTHFDYFEWFFSHCCVNAIWLWRWFYLKSCKLLNLKWSSFSILRIPTIDQMTGGLISKQKFFININRLIVDSNWQSVHKDWRTIAFLCLKQFTFTRKWIRQMTWFYLVVCWALTRRSA